MKKFLTYALAAGLALVACTKNEVKPVDVDHEITFQTISTKGASAMHTNNKFVSYSYFLAQGNNWDTNHGDAKLYFGPQLIAYNTTADAWKAENTYFWPKQGKLTFFAWSLNTPAPALDPAPTCSHDKGIQLTSYDSKTSYKDVDFLVAEVAKNHTENTTDVTGKTWAKGVPTVFKHALSKLAFKVQTVDDSGVAYDYSANNTTITVKSIELQSVKNKRAYSQDWQEGYVASKHTWSDVTGTEHIAYPVFTGNQVATSTTEDLVKSAADYEIVIPQEFDSSATTEDLLKIVYDITTSYTSTPVVETVTQYVPLATVYPNNWEPNKYYTLTIKLSLKEIYWAPTVEEWETGSTTPVKF
ncbi:MAG: hypothetical protein ACI3Y4_08555 [Candidatus Cryptobacteroides sp.]